MNEAESKQILEISHKIISAAHAKILLSLRFLEIAMGNLTWEPVFGSGRYACDGEKIFFDPERLILDYKRDREFAVDLYLHEIFHMVFHHGFEYGKKDKKSWDLAADIAVWTVMSELDTFRERTDEDAERLLKLKTLRKRCPQLSAQKLYRLFLSEPPSYDEEAKLKRLFCADSHELWEQPEKIEISLEQWKKITERVKADLKSFSRNKAGGESLDLELADATRQKIDYGKFLRQFMTSGEAIHINDEEFDYVYYNYGLETYGNMPLVEPLEYKDVNRINEFVIALDTSASCKGKVVQDFLQKTVGIMRSEDSFFKKINVHIIQCDDQVRSDTKITCEEDFDDFLKNGKLTGFGSTDFRPVFEYVDKLRDDGELRHIKGLIYFTDGMGVYPTEEPPFKTCFALYGVDVWADKVPHFAYKIILGGEELI